MVLARIAEEDNESILAFEATLYELLGVDSTSALYAPLRYSLQGGQMIRARLSLVVAEYYELPSQASSYAAAAIEMLHAFSLIQDDLPCMDNDSRRRGKPSLHMKFDEHTALLTANSLFAKSFELLAKAAQNNPLTAVKLVELHSQISGAQGMSLGQWHDLSTQINDLEFLIEMYRLKTGVLFGASLKMPAILADAESNQQRQLAALGEVFGIIYQIQDDIIDYKKYDASPRGAELNNICNFGEKIALEVLKKHFVLAKELIEELGTLGHTINNRQFISFSKFT